MRFINDQADCDLNAEFYYGNRYAKYYFESHITIEPLQTDLQVEWLKELVKQFGFRVANLLMVKDRAATPERSNRDTFLTGHGKNLEDIRERTYNCVAAIQDEGIKVWRYKIEDTILDSRNEDVFGLL